MTEPLLDKFGRRHNNLRISVTDRCNIRCTYCMPESVEFQNRDQLLTFEEIARFVSICATMGVNKIRLTGGEPLLRNNLAVLVEMIRQVPGIEDIGMTTNGVLLADQAESLHRAGVRRINISLDTLDEQKFLQITRRNLFDKVMAGIDAADRAGFTPLKINAIAMKGFSDDEVVRLANFCRERSFELRFIEFMPLEADGIWNRDKVLTSQEIREKLAEAGLPTVPTKANDPSAPASEFEYVDGKGKLGIVASVSEPFCGTCNRLRITADGKFRNCLFSLEELDIKTPLRNGASDLEIADLVRQSVADKWAGHLINADNFVRPIRTMHSIGG